MGASLLAATVSQMHGLPGPSHQSGSGISKKRISHDYQDDLLTTSLAVSTMPSLESTCVIWRYMDNTRMMYTLYMHTYLRTQLSPRLILSQRTIGHRPCVMLVRYTLPSELPSSTVLQSVVAGNRSYMTYKTPNAAGGKNRAVHVLDRCTHTRTHCTLRYVADHWPLPAEYIYRPMFH